MTTQHYHDPEELLGDGTPAVGVAAKPAPVRATQAEIEAAEAEELAAAEDLDALNLLAHDLKNMTHQARSNTANKLRAWMILSPVETPLQLARAAIAQGTEDRRQGPAPRRKEPDPVYLNPCDTVGLRNNTASGYVQKQVRHGNSRGTYFDPVTGEASRILNSIHKGRNING
jgi:hypothetical protein